MSIYVVRHGQTDWNRDGAVQGRYDVPLNETGRAQAREAGVALQGIHIDKCYCSPAARARETAEIALDGRDVPIVFDNRLVEIAYGDYEGTNWRLPEYQKARRRIAYRNKNGESYLDVAFRVYGFLEEIREEAEKSNVLLVCHGGVGRVIHSYFVDELDNDQFIDLLMKNAEVRHYEYVTRNVPAVISDYKKKF